MISRKKKGIISLLFFIIFLIMVLNAVSAWTHKRGLVELQTPISGSAIVAAEIGDFFRNTEMRK